MIPWTYISIVQSEVSKKKGGEEYRIQKNGKYLGSIILQAPISEQIKNKMNELAVKLNYV